MKTSISKSNFQYPEDERFFTFLLGKDALFADRFDFSEPTEKRRIFDGLKKQAMDEVAKQERTRCELQLVQDCDSKKLVLDHIIPLSSNELNKHLRKMIAPQGKKVPTQSFGSNHQSNFLVACEKCNNFKKHRFIKKDDNKWLIINVKNQQKNNTF